MTTKKESKIPKKKAARKVKNHLKQAMKWLQYLPQSDGSVRMLTNVLRNARTEALALERKHHD